MPDDQKAKCPEECGKNAERSMSEFIAVTAHKVHTPVASIKWQTEMLLGGDLGELNENQLESLKAIMEAAERLNDLSRALLYVFELEKDLPMIHPQDTDLHAILSKAVENIGALTKERNIHIQCPPKDPPLQVFVDPDLAFVTFRTLLENAVLYSATGSEVTVHATPQDKGLEVAVQDKGCGIPPDLHRFVFTKFFRAPIAKRLWTEGAGLGLYIAKNIVQRTGGTLTFASDEGKGSTFTWFIPAHKAGRQPWEKRGGSGVAEKKE